MSEDLRTQLIRAAVALAVPPYCNLSIEDAYKRFCQELAGLKITDKRNKVIRIHERNFPKLVGMKRRNTATGEIMKDKNGKPLKAKASIVLGSLKAGTFNRKSYWVDYKKLRTIFWIPNAIENAEAVYPNKHGVVEGDQVHMKRYGKTGACIKLVFTNPEGDDRIVITSFLVKEQQLATYVGHDRLWP